MSNPFRRLAFIGPLAILLAIIAIIVLFPRADARAAEARAPANVDYAGFVGLTRDTQAHRSSRLVCLERFRSLAAEPNALILDTRSAAAFAEGHIAGAVNLNFSDFTDEKLAEVVGPKSRMILIYCNNNFSDDVAPVMEKRAPLALNIPTFVNLYGYGYKNIYELSDLTSIDALADAWVAGPALSQINSTHERAEEALAL